jgi:hypothetical protein
MLPRESFEVSRSFLETRARPLEVARLAFHFDGAPAGSVLAALGKYQNPDGGFGQALEPDLRAPESSALCTSLAFQVFREVSAGPDESMVARALAYLLETLDRDRGHWRIIPAVAADSPHAPWWNQAGREEALDAFSLNPTAELLGYLIGLLEPAPADVVGPVTERVVARLEAQAIEMHELLCCLRLLQTQGLPEAVLEPTRRRLGQLITEAVACDPADWQGYSLRPLQVAQGPDSPFLGGLERAVDQNLEFEIESQQADGSWAPTWSWGGAFPDAWETARQEWAGVLTLEKLLTLRRFGRIEGLG